MTTLDLKYLLENIEEHDEYEEYLTNHIKNVRRGYEWFKENLPEVLSETNYIEELAYYGEFEEIIDKHDCAKYNRIPDRDNYYDLTCEYAEYANYFYGERTPEVKDAFDRAWLSHIHQSPHHWQHWLLQNDDPKIGLRVLDMPYVFIVEMILDWWAFSWKTGKLEEIFNWYESNKKGIILSDKTRKTVETILNKLEAALKNND